MGVMLNDEGGEHSSRAPLFADLPVEVELFTGAVTAASFLHHFTVCTASTRGVMTISASFSKFCVSPAVAQQFMAQLVANLTEMADV